MIGTMDSTTIGFVLYSQPLISIAKHHLALSEVDTSATPEYIAVAKT